MTEKVSKTKKGIVISDKMDKTVVVRIDSVKFHEIYRKKYIVSNKFKAADPENQYKTGDMVEIVETRPISRDKKYKVTGKVK